MSRRRFALAACAVATVVAGPTWSTALGAVPSTTAPGALALHGVFRLGPASCRNGVVRGSYLSVTFGTRAVRNPQSSCAHGAITLLPAGDAGLSTQKFTPAAAAGFDRNGGALSRSITAPVSFQGRRLGLVSSGANLQDAPTGPRQFELPQVYLVGGRLVGDLRSVQALYGGPRSSTCAQAVGRGCWLIGAERATGRYDVRTHAFTLQWFSGQSFTSTSAGTVVHLAGTFHGSVTPVPRGRLVELGTQSFAAGQVSASQSVAAARRSGAPAHRLTGRGHGDAKATSSRRAGSAAAAPRAATSSPVSLVAGAAVGLDLLALLFLGAARRPWRTR